MRDFAAKIVGYKRDETWEGTVFPGGPLMTLTENNYYLVAVLEPVYQLAVMKHLDWAGAPHRTYWEPVIPFDGLPIGDARIIPLVDLGSERTR